MATYHYCCSDSSCRDCLDPASGIVVIVVITFGLPPLLLLSLCVLFVAVIAVKTLGMFTFAANAMLIVGVVVLTHHLANY